MTDVRGMVDMRFLAASGVQTITSGDKALNGLRNGDLMSGDQIPVNLTVNSGVTCGASKIFPLIVSIANK
jgi:hypothetical protein